MTCAFVADCVAVLERTPAVLDALLRDLPAAWIEATEGPGTWSPYAVMGHLIHAEEADWMPRMGIILEHGTARAFDPLDREAQFREGVQRPLGELLDEFRLLREGSLARLRELDLGELELGLTGMHPALGVVTARQLLATWAAHDLGHLVQVNRVMAKRYRGEVGPWAAYLSVMGG
jgi:hypothetical protein